MVKNPKKDVNACEDFIDTVTSGLIVAAALAALEMKSLDGIPSDKIVPETLWTQPESERRSWLMKLCYRIYDKFVQFSYGNHKSLKKATKCDGVNEYSIQLLRLGCFYKEYSDAIREGDGGRLLCCWKYMMPMFVAAGNKNYAGEAANLLLQHFYTLSPRLSAQLLWSRCVNVYGGPGKNIPGDLHMEHLNKTVKEAVYYLGANKTEKAIVKIGKAIGTIVPILDQFDSQNRIHSTSSRHVRPDAKNDILTIAGELVKARSFAFEKGRKYKQFSKPKNVLLAKDRNDIVTWLERKLPSCGFP